MFILGLTGSIGCGKSTVASMFQTHKVPVLDSDATVHNIYRAEAVHPVSTAFPGVLGPDGAIDRAALSQKVLGKKEALQKLESIVHPLVQARKTDWLQQQCQEQHPLVVLDIPLLFETGAEKNCDAVLVVVCDDDAQEERVLKRPGMTVEKFKTIRQRQMHTTEKQKRADFVIDTMQTLEETQRHVEELIKLCETRQGTVFIPNS
jgi:dephospho-CoA kinase